MRTNRRRLLQGAAGAGLVLSLGAARPTSIHAAEMDELRIAMAALPPQLDPQTSDWIVMLRVYPMMFDTLIERDWSQNGKLVPGLATEWTQADELTLDLVLREDVLFQDGTPLTANDVKYTFDRSLQNDAKLGVNGIFRLAEVQALDDYTVRFITKQPSGSLLTQLSQRNASIVPAAYHQEVGYEGFQQAPMGSGPFKLIEFVPDSHLKLVRNETYHGGIPAAKSVTVTAIPEVSTRIAALLNGEVDLIVDVPPDQTSLIEDTAGFTLNSVAPLNVNVLDIIGSNPPMDSKDVRQAMSLAIDRETIVDELLLGNGLWPSGIQSIFDPLYVERPQLAYDPERAKSLLTESGYAGEEIQFVFDSPDYYPLQQAWSEAIAAMWREVGLNVTMVPLDVAQRVEISVPDSPYHVITDSAGVLADIEISQSFDSPTAYYTNLHPEGALQEIVTIVQEAETTVDAAKRGEIYQHAFDVMDELTPMIVLFTVNRIAAMKDAIVWEGSPDFGIDLRPANFSVS